ncbi:hypothetical protein AZH53_01215 [Methanomicrobiaceae archaeon CYW5]|nr:hypothetical protein [Methanovulcanius yangii]
MRIVLLLLGIVAMVIASCGCLAGDDTPSPVPVPSPVTPTTTEETWLITEPIIIREDPVFDPVHVEVSARAISNVMGVRVTTLVDASGGHAQNMGSEGVNMFLTAFAYNYESVPYDFNPQSYQDIIDAKIPYTSMTKLIFPGNVDPPYSRDVMQIKGRTSEIDPSKPWNYGVVLNSRT